jgi:serine/threonine protein kinase
MNAFFVNNFHSLPYHFPYTSHAQVIFDNAEQNIKESIRRVRRMEQLQQNPDASEYFDFSTRRFVGNAKRTLRQVSAPESFKNWDLWVSQALAALAKLHEAGFVHGAIDPSVLVINEQNNLRLGGLQKIREKSVTVIEPFAPNNLLLPPEQNLYAAFRQSVPFERAFQSLAQANWSQDQLETIFERIKFSHPIMFGLYEKIQSEPLYSKMQQAGDVWMLGFALLSRYYELLEWPYVTTTEFYQTRHEEFHDLIESMVYVNPSNRVTALEALKVWAPQEVPTVSVSPSLSPTAAVTSDVASDAVLNTVTDAVVGVALVGGAGAATASRRPYLALQSHPAGRSKTRRSLRSSNPNSATNSSAQPIVG